MHIQLKYCITYITILYNQKIIGAAATPHTGLYSTSSFVKEHNQVFDEIQGHAVCVHVVHV